MKINIIFIWLLLVLGVVNSNQLFAQQIRLDLGDLGLAGIESDGQFIYVSATQGQDNLFMKLDTNFTMYWSKRNPTPGGSYTSMRGTSIDNSGNLIRVGSTNINSVGNYDLLLIKTNTNSDTVLTRRFGSNRQRTGNSIFKISDGYIMDVFALNSSSVPNIGLIKINENADTVFTRFWDGLMQDGINSIVEHPDNSIYFTGSTKSYAQNTLDDAIFVKLDASGNFVWGQSYGTTAQDVFYAVDVAADGSGFFIYGSSSGFGSSIDMISKIDNNGNILWNKSVASSSGDIYLNGLKSLPDGSFMIYGSTTNPVDNSYGNGFVAKISSSGNFLWAKCYGGYNITNFSNVTILPSGSMIFAGTQYDEISTESDLYLVKIDQNGNSNSCYQNEIVLSFTNRIYSQNTFTPVEYSGINVGGLNHSTVNKPFVAFPYVDFDLTFDVTDNICGEACSGSATVASNGTSPFFYEWNTFIPNFTSTINNQCAGTYSVIVSDNSGCTKMDSIEIGVVSPLIPICYATVDTISYNHNVVYWDSITHPGVDSLLIMREISTGVYSEIAAIGMPAAGNYHDLSANPNVSGYRYKMIVKDTCGNESPLDSSQYHNTIHLQYLGSGNFQWSFYQVENVGTPVNTYEIYRDDLNAGTFNLIGSVPGSQQTFTDVAFGGFPNAVYRVDVDWGLDCSPTRAGVNTSRSNIKNQSIANGLDFIEQEVFSYVYPNPFNEMLQLNSSFRMNQYTVRDLSGRVISEFNLNSHHHILDLSSMASGIYFIEISSEGGIDSHKIIKQ